LRSGVDPEQAMLEAARNAAARAGQNLDLIKSTAEALPREIGPFDIVTVGHALHWMDRERVSSLFERLVAPNGAIIVCSARSATDGRNPWLDAYNEARRFWSGAREMKRYRPDFTAVLQSTRFRPAESIVVESQHDICAGHLARRLLTFSTLSPEMLGDKVDTMRCDVEQRLLPFSRAGQVTESVVSTANVARRADRLSSGR
jgi:SAM-dependent methyltransferase